ncbi:MAG: bifunctional phosphoribosyl-AMP cyclohydrolase/phosphoribosyl-ATP diphosphatase HisIE [Deltaproteobacteria bacterium]|nr:bifunctional phosphoribosyl-AMP cyclohydrolase/phosphoribosyl-ATP diphosphatase HisIE [Deltaproteobacteria bacterium]
MNLAPAAVEALLSAVRFGPDGLVAVTAQDATTGVVRMQAYANAEALANTVKTGRATFWSRSRQELWEKGLTSGNGMPVQEVRIDCDGDAVLYVTQPEGPSCHTGATSCYFRKLTDEGLVNDGGPPEVPAAVISKVAAVISARRAQTSEKSYVASLLTKGLPKILEKIAEEAGELAEALPQTDRAHTTHEAADLIFHVMVGLEAANIPITDVFAELNRRFGTSGHVEKANRPPKA